MKIGITGDTHGSKSAIEDMLDLNMDFDMWLHTGDYFMDADFLRQKSKLPVIGVCGNNDVTYHKEDYQKIIKIQDKTILLLHGHRVKKSLAQEAKEQKADIVVYGHTHVANIFWQDDILFINPGSPAYPRQNTKPGFAYLQIEERQSPQAFYVKLN